jgi:hypothetical protein
MVERYWLFAAFCLLVAIVLIRMVLRERLSLQSSISYLAFLATMAATGLFPRATEWVSREMGFTLPSNFLFAAAIVLLALLHLSALATISRIELRSIMLTQELGLLRERLERRIEADRDREAH